MSILDHLLYRLRSPRAWWTGCPCGGELFSWECPDYDEWKSWTAEHGQVRR